jgi:hypothetical protein
LRSIRPQGLYIFRDFIEARGGERIFIEDAVATRFHVPNRSGLVGQTCVHECSKFLVLKIKIEFKMQNSGSGPCSDPYSGGDT